jgi:hypothetical protein
MRAALLLILLLCAAASGPVTATRAASTLAISVRPDAANPASPQMGDRLLFHSAVAATAAAPAALVWLSLVEVDPGHEQPVDLEDWSAQKAVVLPALAAGSTIETDWTLRLIQSGDYRVMIQVLSQGADLATASRSLAFRVREKSVVESGRILPVAAGMPLILAAALFRSRRRTRRPGRASGDAAAE